MRSARRRAESPVLQAVFTGVPILFAALCVIPYVLVLSGSFTEERVLTSVGLSLVPPKLSLDAYRILFADMRRILNAYRITLTTTVLGTFLSLLVNGMLAYVLSKRTLRYRRGLSFYCAFTMLFSGGMVPWYIVCVNYLRLYHQFWALVLPYVANAWHMFLLRNYFRSLPEEIFESASLDGAGELRTFFTIALPLALPAIASVGLFIALGYWNDWWLGIMLTDGKELMPMQLLLRAIVSNTLFLTSGNASHLATSAKPPAEGVKYATTIVTIGPILLLYPFVQRYFVKGLTVGSVKG